MNASFMRNPARLCALLFLLIVLAFAVQADLDGGTSWLIPLGCLLVMVLAAVSELLAAGRERVALAWSRTEWRGLLLFGLYVVLIHLAGFLAATPLFTAAVFGLMSADGHGTGRRRNMVKGFAFGALLAAAVYGLFVTGMGNLLPMGFLDR